MTEYEWEIVAECCPLCHNCHVVMSTNPDVLEYHCQTCGHDW